MKASSSFSKLLGLGKPAISLAGFLLLVCAAGLPAVPARADIFPAETFTLENGLQVVVIPNHRVPVVVQAVLYKVGAADGPPGKNGIAHFLEHLMFKATGTLAAGQFSQEVDRRGGSDNAYTNQDTTVYHQEIAAQHLELIMRMEADRMVNLRLTDEVVLPERDVILQERLQTTDDDPSSRMREALQAALFLNHPYRLPIIGWKHEIEGYTTEDAVEFYQTYYAPNNAVLIVSGDVETAEVRALAEKYFGPIEAREVPPRQRLSEPPAPAPRRIEIEDERVRQPFLTRAYTAPSYRSAKGREAYALSVLATILTGSASSRLNQELVLKQKTALGVSANYDGDDLDLGTFRLYATPRLAGDLDKLEAALDLEIERLLREGVTEEEVARAKRQLQIAAVKTRDSITGPAFIVAQALGSGRSLQSIQSWPDLIDDVTPGDVLKAARAVLRPEASMTGVLVPKAADVASDQ